jgi:hypothetical protein
MGRKCLLPRRNIVLAAYTDHDDERETAILNPSVSISVALFLPPNR